MASAEEIFNNFLKSRNRADRALLTRNREVFLGIIREEMGEEAAEEAEKKRIEKDVAESREWDRRIEAEQKLGYLGKDVNISGRMVWTHVRNAEARFRDGDLTVAKSMFGDAQRELTKLEDAYTSIAKAADLSNPYEERIWQTAKNMRDDAERQYTGLREKIDEAEKKAPAAPRQIIHPPVPMMLSGVRTPAEDAARPIEETKDVLAGLARLEPSQVEMDPENDVPMAIPEGDRVIIHTADLAEKGFSTELKSKLADAIKEEINKEIEATEGDVTDRQIVYAISDRFGDYIINGIRWGHNVVDDLHDRLPYYAKWAQHRLKLRQSAEKRAQRKRYTERDPRYPELITRRAQLKKQIAEATRRARQDPVFTKLGGIHTLMQTAGLRLQLGEVQKEITKIEKGRSENPEDPDLDAFLANSTGADIDRRPNPENAPVINVGIDTEVFSDDGRVNVRTAGEPSSVFRDAQGGQYYWWLRDVTDSKMMDLGWGNKGREDFDKVLNLTPGHTYQMGTGGGDRKKRYTFKVKPKGGEPEAPKPAPSIEKREQEDLSRAVQSPVADALPIPLPEGVKLYPFQRVGVLYMKDREWSLLADEQGLGKTIQAIATANLVGAQNILVVCPASLLLNWKRELEAFSTIKRTIHVHLDNKEPIPDARPIAVIVNYEKVFLKPTFESLMAIQWDMIACDEAHKCKNPKAKRTKAIYGSWSSEKGATPGLIDRAKKKIFITGTPFPNRPIEIYPFLSHANPRWRNWRNFVTRYCDAHEVSIGRGRTALDVSGHSNEAELQMDMRSIVMVRRLKADAATFLPPKTRQIIPLQPVGALKRKLQKQKERLEAELGYKFDSPQGLEQAGELASRLVGFTEMTEARTEYGFAKAPFVAEHVKDLIEGGAGKVIVFANFDETIDEIIAHICKAGAKEEEEDGGSEEETSSPDFCANCFDEKACIKLNQSVPVSERQALVDRFQKDPSVKVAVLSIGVGGVGITMTSSHTVVFAEYDWVPGNNAQAEDRAHRIGQAQNVLIQYLVWDDSLDAHILKTFLGKEQVAAKILDIKPTEAQRERAEAEAPKAPEPPKSSIKETEFGEKPPIPAVEKKPAAEKPPISLDVKEALLEAAQQVASMCDRAYQKDFCGFNKMDQEFGHEVAHSQIGDLEERDWKRLFTIMRKYKRQIDPELYGRIYGKAPEKPPAESIWASFLAARPQDRAFLKRNKALFMGIIEEELGRKENPSRSQGLPLSSFNQADLEEGAKHEQEHAGNARRIAADHLAEDPDYYRKLKKAGL